MQDLEDGVGSRTTGLALNETGFITHVVSEAAPGEDMMNVVSGAMQAFYIAVKKFPEISSVRLDGNHPELAMPLDHFAESYGFSLLVDLLRPFITGYGYGYTDRVPAGILLKFMHLMVPAIAGWKVDMPVVFPCGFQSLPEAMAKDMDVHLGAKVSSIERKSNLISLHAEGQPKMEFDHLVISTTLDLVPGFMDLDDLEEGLFGKLSFNRYLASLVNIDFKNREKLENVTEAEVEYYADQGYEENKNRITILGGMPGSESHAEMAYQIIDQSISREEALAVLEEDMASYWQGSVINVIAQREWPNYFPTVSSQDFAEGFYDDMESLQGRKNTYYVGSQLSFETVYFSEWYARDLISRKFPLVRNETTSASSFIGSLPSVLFAFAVAAFLSS